MILSNVANWTLLPWGVKTSFATIKLDLGCLIGETSGYVQTVNSHMNEVVATGSFWE